MAAAPGREATPVTRALDYHAQQGNIKGWAPIPGVSRRYTVDLNGGGEARLLTKATQEAFCAALASADRNPHTQAPGLEGGLE